MLAFARNGEGRQEVSSCLLKAEVKRRGTKVVLRKETAAEEYDLGRRNRNNNSGTGGSLSYTGIHLVLVHIPVSKSEIMAGGGGGHWGHIRACKIAGKSMVAGTCWPIKQ